jgi:hypothetical protein
MKFMIIPLVILLQLSSALTHAGAKVGGQATDESGPTARSLFSSGYGVKFDAQAPVYPDVALPGATDAGDTTEAQVASADTIDSNETESDQAVEPEVIQAPISNSAPEKQLPAPETINAGPSYAGLSYELFKQESRGEFERTSPGQIFRTGDRVFLEVTSNISGTLVTGNIDSNFKATLLSVDDVEAGLVTRVPAKGALKFVGIKGTEKLVFVLSEQLSTTMDDSTAGRYVKQCSAGPSTRSLIVDDEVGNEFQVLNSDGTCSVGNANNRTRSIIVDIEDDVGYGVIENDVLRSGKLLSLIINLEHQ